MTGPSRRHLKNRMECQQALTACASIDQPAVVHSLAVSLSRFLDKAEVHSSRRI